MRWICKGNCRKWLAIFTIAAGPFFGEVHRVAMTSAVAGGIYFMAGCKCIGQQRDEGFDLRKIFAIGKKCIERRLRLS